MCQAASVLDPTGLALVFAQRYGGSHMRRRFQDLRNCYKSSGPAGAQAGGRDCCACVCVCVSVRACAECGRMLCGLWGGLWTGCEMGMTGGCPAGARGAVLVSGRTQICQSVSLSVWKRGQLGIKLTKPESCSDSFAS